ncbi:hypothetical protein NA57DRAFT_31576 [Rhizodiscina lignyota]|uniref:DUF8004 domain-containing protein n=1 Tax=Rhizodiscina lignyota TaxID=1504668 RepID=A0A9P4INY8_9PEZI|nr:hypothetical protein NA57DRAFT_31576 [Rhizodiscina lignyota]
MLSDLQNVMDTFYELNDHNERRDSTQDIIYYLSERNLDDVRDNLKAALGLLAWCEMPGVRWEEGYTETFVHCVGMMTSDTVEMPEFKSLSRPSRHNLEYAYNSLQLRIIEAEEKLSSFNFNELWDVEGVAPNSEAMRSFDAFRAFLLNYYGREYHGWPPRKTQGRWLTRTIAGRLQRDFGLMYDYFVDRDVAWDVSEARATRKWEMVRTRPSSEFSADSSGLPLTDMLVAFDSKHKYQHIPYPYPLLPQAATPQKAAPIKKGLFGGLKKAKAVAQRDPKEHFQTSLAFNGATNINRFGFPTEDNHLIDDVQQHEKSLPQSIASPTSARMGRWILLYGILQVLSTIAVDTEGLKYTKDVYYFLCPSLKDCPPWLPTSDNPPRYIQSSQERSYCWEAPSRWVEHRATPPAYGEPRTMYDLHEGGAIRSELDGHNIGRMAGVPSPNNIGMALFPNINDLSLMDKGGVAGQDDIAVRGGALKPSLPIRSPRRMASPTLGPTSLTPEQNDWASGYFGSFRG